MPPDMFFFDITGLTRPHQQRLKDAIDYPIGTPADGPSSGHLTSLGTHILHPYYSGAARLPAERRRRRDRGRLRASTWR